MQMEPAEQSVSAFHVVKMFMGVIKTEPDGLFIPLGGKIFFNLSTRRAKMKKEKKME